MTLEPNAFASEISDALAATGKKYTITVIDLGKYGTSYEITRKGLDRRMHVTPADGYLIDISLFDETGATIAGGTIFGKAAADITPAELATIIGICF